MLVSMVLPLCVPQTDAEQLQVDFTAFAQRGEANPTEARIEIITNPEFYLADPQFTYFYGDYTLFRIANTKKIGICDYRGVVHGYLPEEVDAATLLPSGLIVGNNYSNNTCALFLNSGKQVTSFLHGNVNIEMGEPRKYEVFNITNQNGERQESWVLDQNGNVVLKKPIIDGVTDDGIVYYRDPATFLQGICKLDGTSIVDCSYSMAILIDENTLLVEKDGLSGVVTIDGTVVLPLEKCNLSVVTENLLQKAVYVDQTIGDTRYNGYLYGLIRKDGSVLLPVNYTNIRVLTSVNYQGTRFLNAENNVTGENVLIDLEQEKVYDGTVYIFTDDVLAVKTDDGYQLVDNQLNPYPGTSRSYYDSVTMDDDRLLLSWTENGQTCFEYYALDQQKSLGVLEAIQGFLLKDGIVLRTDENLSFYSKDMAMVSTADPCQNLIFINKCFVMAETVDGWDYNANDQNAIRVIYNASGKALAGNKIRTGSARSMYAENFVSYQDETGLHLIDWNGDAPLGDILMETGSDSPFSAFATYTVERKTGFFRVVQPEDRAFLDVEKGLWYTEPINFCYNAGLMNGMGKGQFQPQAQMTRAMLVQVLYNISGYEAESYGFMDVASNRWYYKAINWAAKEGIVNGMTATTFAPDLPVTREQMVTILQRYAAKFGPALAKQETLSAYNDAGKVSNFARGAMCWAVENGIINGKTPVTLDPQGKATRAEIATVLMRFVRLMAQKQAEEPTAPTVPTVPTMPTQPTAPVG